VVFESYKLVVKDSYPTGQSRCLSKECAKILGAVGKARCCVCRDRSIPDTIYPSDSRMTKDKTPRVRRAREMYEVECLSRLRGPKSRPALLEQHVSPLQLRNSRHGNNAHGLQAPSRSGTVEEGQLTSIGSFT
jgi:hypothetical protein